jgi:hypothetical protein
MKYSLFAPSGLHKYQAGKPLAEAIHETAIRLFAKYDRSGGGLETQPGALVDYVAFVLAIRFARIAANLQNADGERYATGAYYLLAQTEAEYGLQRGAADTLLTRRTALGEAKRAPRGNARAELVQQLRDTLGDDYGGIFIADASNAVEWPADLGDAPQLLAEANIERKIVQIVPAISTDLGSPQQVRYTPIDPNPDVGHTLTVGDRLVVEPEILGRAEVVTVESLAIGDPELYFTATFEQAHEPGCVAAQMPFPASTSTQRAILVALSEDAAVDPVLRGKADKLLDRILSGVTTWSLCGLSGTDTIGPWTIGDPDRGQLGRNPIGTITVT